MTEAREARTAIRRDMPSRSRVHAVVGPPKLSGPRHFRQSRLFTVAHHHSRLGHFHWRGHPHDEERTGGNRRARGDGGVDLDARMGSLAR